MTTEPETQPQEPDGESQVPDDDERRAGVLWLLGLGFFVALIACMFAQAHARDGVKLAQEFGVELSVLGRLYANAGAAVFAFPVVVLLAGLGVTKAGRVTSAGLARQAWTGASMPPGRRRRRMLNAL